MNKAKYIMFEIEHTETPFVFPMWLAHSDIVEQIVHTEVLSAGFVSFHSRDGMAGDASSAYCYGESSMPSKPRAKPGVWLGRPSVATSSRNATLIAWVEGPERGKPDTVAWQGFDTIRRVGIGRGKRVDADSGTFPSVVVHPGGEGFTVLY